MTTRANVAATATALEEETPLKQQHQQRRKAAALFTIRRLKQLHTNQKL